MEHTATHHNGITLTPSSIYPFASTHFFAQTNSYNYGEGTYSTGDVYSGSDPTPANTGGNLSDTGIAIIFTITVGTILVFGAIITKIWKRPPSKKSNEK
jgi:hypothetical protein